MSFYGLIRVKLSLSVLVIVLLFHNPSIAQQSNSPPCPMDLYARRHLCFGTLTFPDGAIYVGEFKDDKYDGQGTLTFPDGAKYVGAFKDDEYSGQGTYAFPDGAKYVGAYKDGLKNGQGTYTFPDGAKYVGAFKDGLKNGQGTLTFPDGAKYVGAFKDDKYSGQGTYAFPDGSKYVGAYKGGKKNGQGTLTFPDGAKYVGAFKDGLKNGQGTLTFPDGAKYVGAFKDDEYDGQGTFTLTNGEIYVGEFKGDKPNGKGTYTFPNGTKYSGEFKDGKYDGKGILYNKDGSVNQKGIWADNKLIQTVSVDPVVAPPNPQTITPGPVKSQQVSSGSAFRVEQGKFVTNNHVIKQCEAMKVGGKMGGAVLAIDPINDLALISVPNDDGEIASIRTIRPVLNEAATVAGFPLQGLFAGIAITNGTVSRLSGLNGNTAQLQISAPVQPGNSGGPLLDAAGNVIGVVSAKLDAVKVAGATGDIPENVNFAIGGNTLRAFLDAKGVNYKEVGKEPDIRGEQIAARASAFTVLVECN